jgi:hypothetical protein
MAIARPIPSTMEMTKPIPVTSNVAGKWTENKISRNSHILRTIALGDGKIYISLIILAAVSHIGRNISMTEREGTYRVTRFI